MLIENNQCVFMGDYPVFSHTCVGVHVVHACVDHEIGTCNIYVYLSCMKYKYTKKFGIFN